MEGHYKVGDVFNTDTALYVIVSVEKGVFLCRALKTFDGSKEGRLVYFRAEDIDELDD